MKRQHSRDEVLQLDRTSGVPLYKQIELHLRGRIVQGRIKPGDRLPSIRGLSKEFGVNHLTVRQALRNLVNEGFLASSQGRGTYVQESVRAAAKLALIVPNLSHPLPDAISRGVRGVMDEHGAGGIALFNSHDDVAAEVDNVAQAVAENSQGLIIFSLMKREATVAALRSYLTGCPVVWVDRFFLDLPIWYASSDNRHGGYLAAEHLLKQGRRRIAFVAEMVHETVLGRFEGYREALGDHGVPFDRRLVGVADGGTPAVPEAVRKVLTVEPRPDAFFFGNDYWALAGLQQIKAAGLRVPDDVAVVGYDDMAMAAYADPPLTTIRQDAVAMGKAAAELFLEQFELSLDERLARAQHRLIPVELILRQSG